MDGPDPSLRLQFVSLYKLARARRHQENHQEKVEPYGVEEAVWLRETN